MNQAVGVGYRGSSHQLVVSGEAGQGGLVGRLDSLGGVMMSSLQAPTEHVHYQMLPPLRNKVMVDVSTMTDPEEDESSPWHNNVTVPSNTKVAEYLSSLRQFFKDADGTKFRMDVPGSTVMGQTAGVVTSGVSGMMPTMKSTSSSAPRRKEHRNDDVEHRPYGCAQCGKAFKRNEHLARHIVTHSGLKPHACMHCGKAFYRKDHLIKHAQSHSQPPRPKVQIP